MGFEVSGIQDVPSREHLESAICAAKRRRSSTKRDLVHLRGHAIRIDKRNRLGSAGTRFPSAETSNVEGTNRRRKDEEYKEMEARSRESMSIGESIQAQLAKRQ